MYAKKETCVLIYLRDVRNYELSYIRAKLRTFSFFSLDFFFSVCSKITTLNE